VSGGQDDDALAWAGDDDPTLSVGRQAPEVAPVLPPGFTAVGRGAEQVRTARSDQDAVPDAAATDAPAPARTGGQTGSAALVATGVIAGIYLLYAVGWLIGGLRLGRVAGLLVTPAHGTPPPMWVAGNLVGVWLAVAASVIWFGAVLLLTRSSRPWVRWAWLAAGVVLLVPWPLLMVPAVPA